MKKYRFSWGIVTEGTKNGKCKTWNLTAPFTVGLDKSLCDKIEKRLGAIIKKGNLYDKQEDRWF